MNNSVLFPQYKDCVKLYSTSLRMTQKQLEDLEHLKGATASPNIGRTIETIVTAHHREMEQGLLKPEDFIPQDDRKTCTVSFKVNVIFKESVAELQHFYSAPSMSAVVAHTIDWYTRVLEQHPDAVPTPPNVPSVDSHPQTITVHKQGIRW